LRGALRAAHLFCAALQTADMQITEAKEEDELLLRLKNDSTYSSSKSPSSSSESKSLSKSSSDMLVPPGASRQAGPSITRHRL
jgi:hypothetical protein